MVMNKKILICLTLIILSGCTNQTHLKGENDELKRQIINLESKLNEEREKNTKLVNEITELKQSFEGYEPNDVISFKDSIKINAKILQKQEGDNLYPYYIIVTMDDRDHNTPLLIAVENITTYNQFKEGEKYDLNVYVEAVIDRKNNVIRFMYTILPKMYFDFNG